MIIIYAVIGILVAYFMVSVVSSEIKGPVDARVSLRTDHSRLADMCTDGSTPVSRKTS